MWIMMNDSFLSIVEDEKIAGNLLVRARRAEDIEAVFGNVNPEYTAERDYHYRISCSRDVVAHKLWERVGAIDYPNFKNSVVSDLRHSLYAKVWEIMHGWQIV